MTHQTCWNGCPGPVVTTVSGVPVCEPCADFYINGIRPKNESERTAKTIEENRTKTVGEWLTDHFGESAKMIEGFSDSHYTSLVSKRPKLTIDKGGRIFLLCGGEAIMSFSRSDNIRGSVFVVYDDAAGKSWDAKFYRAGCANTPRPSAKLKLAYSI